MAEAALRYKDKVTIVTGGNSGIGRGCVEVFCKSPIKWRQRPYMTHGSRVVIASNSEGGGKQLEAELNKKGPGEAFFIFCDVTKEDDIKNMVNRTVERFGRLDCLINNAGWQPPYQRIDDVSGENFEKLLKLNIVSYFLVAKHCLPYLRKTKGNIIQTSSISGYLGQSGASTYCATKGAVSAFTRALAIDEAANGVRVNAFSPTTIHTPLVQSIADLSDNADKLLADASNTQVLGRMGTIEEVGKACLFLAADATLCTGIDLLLSGGSELGTGVKNPLMKEPGSLF